MDMESFHFLTQNSSDWVSRFATTALPTDLTDQQLRELGFRSHREVKFLVKCPDYPNCTVFLKLYSEAQWITLGQSADILESYNGRNYLGLPTVMLLTYKLKEPIFYARLSREPTFDMYSPSNKYCTVHDLYNGQPMTPDEEFFVHDLSVDCCSTAEHIIFCFTLLGIEVQM